MGFNLVEVRNFVGQVDKLRSKIVSDEGYGGRILSQGDDYFRIKNFSRKSLAFCDARKISRLNFYTG